MEIFCPSKAFIGSFDAFDDWHGHVFLGKLSVEVKDHAGFINGFLASSVGGMPLLPVKLRGAQKQTGTHFPTHHIGPLVD